MRVHCPSCMRREVWEGSERTVELEGGSRRPGVHPELAAWETLRGARASGVQVVAACVCGQPLLGDGPGASIPWTVRAPGGDVVVDGGFTGPSGPLTEAEADAWVRAELREPVEVGAAVFRGVVLLPMLVPLLLWVVAVTAVVTFLANFGRGMPP